MTSGTDATIGELLVPPGDLRQWNADRAVDALRDPKAIRQGS